MMQGPSRKIKEKAVLATLAGTTLVVVSPKLVRFWGCQDTPGLFDGRDFDPQNETKTKRLKQKPWTPPPWCPRAVFGDSLLRKAKLVDLWTPPWLLIIIQGDH